MPSYRSLRNLGLGVAAAVPLSLAISSQAQAVPYAYASNTDSGFTIFSVSGGSYTPLQNTATFTTQNAISSTFLTAQTPPGPSTIGTGLGNNISDAAQVYAGNVANKPAENTFTQSLTGVSSPALRADSLDTAFAGGGGNVAEGNFQNGPAGGSGSGQGKLSSKNTSTISVTVGAGAVLQIEFTDTAGLQASTRALNFESASAAISSSVSIINSDGVTVFSFAPNGQNTGVTGGTSLTDPFSLNANVSSTSGTPGDATFPGAAPGTVFRTGFFSAQTNALAGGNYTINISQQSNIDLTVGVPTQTPEPASLALLGAGLIGFGVFRRRKAS